MTTPPDGGPGLPPAARDALAAQVAACLATIGPAPMRQQVDDALTALFNTALADHDHNADALFEIAYACLQVAVFGAGAGPAISNVRFAGKVEPILADFPGVDVAAVADIVRVFGTAVLNADRTAAHSYWTDLARQHHDLHAPAPQPMSGTLVAFLYACAICGLNRNTGVPGTIDLGPGTTWPPMCDFCATARATHVFPARPHAHQARPGRAALSGLTINYADPNWYACRRCRTDVEAVPPRYERVAARHPAVRARPNNNSVLATFADFETARKGRYARRLPAERPDLNGHS